MTLFQMTAMWGLRAALALAAFEMGEPLVTRGLDLANNWQDIHLQAAVMDRLVAKANAAEQQARTALAAATNTQDAFVLKAEGTVPAPDAAAAFVRGDLIAGGASDVVITARTERGDGALTPILVDAQWRERAESDGRPLSTLALRRPGLLLVSLSERANQDGASEVKAVFKVFAARDGGKI